MRHRILGIIPARKGSKGLPGKNIKLLGDKPLVAHTITAALDVKGIDVYMTTDDEQVLSIAHSYGLNIDYRRPDHLAQDASSMADVVMDLLLWLNERGFFYDTFVLLQPTSPFRTAAAITEAIDILYSHKVPSVVGVSPMWTKPWECVEVFQDASWKFLVEPQSGAVRRQDYKDAYHFINGSIYAVPVDLFIKEKKFVYPDSFMMIMDEINTIDIDTERDFLCAKSLFEQKN